MFRVFVRTARVEQHVQKITLHISSEKIRRATCSTYFWRKLGRAIYAMYVKHPLERTAFLRSVKQIATRYMLCVNRKEGPEC